MNLLVYQGHKIVMSPFLQRMALKYIHDDEIAGHLGYEEIPHQVSEFFFLKKGMAKDGAE